VALLRTELVKSFILNKMAFFIVSAVETSNPTSTGVTLLLLFYFTHYIFRIVATVRKKAVRRIHPIISSHNLIFQ
jgi:hypothetical protein